MKKSHVIIAIVLAVVLVIGIAALVVFNSPEYALWQVSRDVKESGLKGLSPHLTKNAQTVVDAVVAVSDNKLVSSLLGLVGQNAYVGVLKSEIQSITWELEDILKSSKNVAVILGFNYQELLIGTIEISMIREDGQWKINGIELPKFDKIIL